MCTVVVSINPGRPWPLLLAADRDEMLARPWDPPAEYWPSRPGVIGGRDRTGGGTWMGVNRAGVVAAVLNRTGSLGPAPGKRSRGELPLFALEAETAETAAARIGGLDAGAYRSFNMVIADRAGAIVLRATEAGRPERLGLGPGTHMVTARDPDDLASPQIARHLPRFRGQPLPEPPDWGAWAEILGEFVGAGGCPNQRRAARRFRHRLFVPAGDRQRGPYHVAVHTGSARRHPIPAGDARRLTPGRRQVMRLGAWRRRRALAICTVSAAPLGSPEPEAALYCGARPAPARRRARAHPETERTSRWPADASSTKGRPKSCSRGRSPVRWSSLQG